MNMAEDKKKIKLDMMNSFLIDDSSLLKKIRENVGIKSYISPTLTETVNSDKRFNIPEVEELSYELITCWLYRYIPGYHHVWFTSDNDKRVTAVKDKVIDLLKKLNENNAKLKVEYQNFYGSEKEMPAVVSNILNNQIGYCKNLNEVCFFNKYKTDRALVDLSRIGSKSEEQSYLLKSNQKPFSKNPIYEQLLDLKNFESVFIDSFVMDCIKSSKLLSPDLGTEEMRFGLLMECFNRDFFNRILNNCTKMNIDVCKFLSTIDKQKQSELTSEIGM